MIRLVLLLVGSLFCLGVGFGFAGAVHPAADTLSLVRMPLGAVCLLMALLRGLGAMRVVLLVAGLAAAVTTVPPWFAGQPGGELTLYNKNLWYRNPELPALAADIVASGAEVVTLQEVSRSTNALLDILVQDYPHQHLCDFNRWAGIAVLSKHPIADQTCSSRRAAAAAQIIKDDQLVWVVSVHLQWPFPYLNKATSTAVTDVLERLDGPVVVGGDFNIFPWASSVQDIRRASGTQMAGPLWPSYVLNGAPLFLDHAYAPGGGEVTYRPLLGSDHYGVLARLRLEK